jgi:16S rRNA (uracil1498-N3)-methyltransferase
LVAKPLPTALERLRRTVIEASKQCGRNRLMEIAEPQDWPKLIEGSGGIEHRWLAHPARSAAGDAKVAGTLRVPSARSADEASSARRMFPADGVLPVPSTLPAAEGGRHTECACYLVAVGPEGGFTDDEVRLATAAGWQCVDLGPRILRVETAALLTVAWVVLRN